MRTLLLCTLVFASMVGLMSAQETAAIRTADGFQCPVGPNGTGEGYYIARSYMPNGHLGDDWNGIKGGDTDFGDPVYATAYGLVVFAKNYHVGWGNVVIIRHAFYEGSTLKYVDSLYGHLSDFNVHEGQQVRRGQMIGHIGNNNGMYDAHLHFEMRKNLNIGMYRGSFPRDFTNYYTPNKFIAAHLVCPRGDKIVQVPINTFPQNAPPSYVAAKVSTPVYSPGTAPASHLPPPLAGLRRAPTRSLDDEPKVVTNSQTIPKVTPSSPSTTSTKSASTTSSSNKSNSGSSNSASRTVSTEATAPTIPKRRPVEDEDDVMTPKSSSATASKTPSSKPLALENDAYEPPAPPPSGSPIRRSVPNFRVDRFQDLRGQNY